MDPQPFSDLVKRWLADAEHPGIVKVQTCAEIGRWEQPCGVKVTLADGWAVLVQMVGTYPPGGATSPPNPQSRIPWADREDYKAARATDEAAVSVVKAPPRGASPQMRAGQVLAVIEDVVKRADLTEVASVKVATPKMYGDARPCLRVTFGDGSGVTGYAAGVMAPGSTQFDHPAHEIPAGWF